MPANNAFCSQTGLGRHGRGSPKKEMVARSFRKCGISVAIDGSENSEIHIEGIDDYAIEDEEDEEFTDEDPFDDIENADPLSDTDAGHFKIQSTLYYILLS